MVDLGVGGSGTGGAGVREFVLECVRRLVCVCELSVSGLERKRAR
jgi:hypothetical protein